MDLENIFSDGEPLGSGRHPLVPKKEQEPREFGECGWGWPRDQLQFLTPLQIKQAQYAS
jgi:hypothetical protein